MKSDPDQIAARRFGILGALVAAMAVAAGAFGAHALRTRLDVAMQQVFETGVRYQMYHALGLLLVAGLLGAARPLVTRRAAVASGWCFVLGILLFSVPLQVLALSGARRLGLIAPVGGLAFIAGWVLLLVAMLPTPSSSR